MPKSDLYPRSTVCLFLYAIAQLVNSQKNDVIDCKKIHFQVILYCYNKRRLDRIGLDYFKDEQ